MSAAGESRTHTVLLPPVFETGLSAISALRLYRDLRPARLPIPPPRHGFVSLL